MGVYKLDTTLLNVPSSGLNIENEGDQSFYMEVMGVG